MVVKITPPDERRSRASKSSRLSACSGVCRKRCSQREKVPKSWPSRSMRSVSTTMVGFSIFGCWINLSAVIFKNNEIAYQVKKAAFLEHAFDQHVELQRPLRSKIFAVHCAPGHEALPV